MASMNIVPYHMSPYGKYLKSINNPLINKLIPSPFQVTPMLNSIFILANLLISPHRTCGTVVSRILVRDSTNYIKNNIKDTHNNRNSNRKRIKVRKALILLLPPQLSLEAAIIVVIPKSIRPTSDLKIIAIASASLSTIIVMMTTSAMHSMAIEYDLAAIEHDEQIVWVMRYRDKKNI